MKDKLGGAAFVLMLFGAGCMDSPDLTIPVAILLVSFALMGIVFAMECREGLHGSKLKEKAHGRKILRRSSRDCGKEEIRGNRLAGRN